MRNCFVQPSVSVFPVSTAMFSWNAITERTLPLPAGPMAVAPPPRCAYIV